MTIDYTGPEGGRMALSFAAGCTATWVFVRNLVMKPAIKSCHQQIADLRELLDEYREQRRLDRARISQLETVLLMHGNGELREAMQKVISETRIEAAGALAAAERKIAP